jgi:hypothetical protein
VHGELAFCGHSGRNWRGDDDAYGEYGGGSNKNGRAEAPTLPKNCAQNAASFHGGKSDEPKVLE